MTRRPATRSRRAAALAGLAATCLVLAGCTGDDGGGSRFEVPALGPADVDVDTPALRRATEAAGVEDCPEVAPDATAVPGGLPDVTLPCFGGGGSVDLSGLRGPMVISVWAAWCGPCREEMPQLQAFHERYGDEVALLGIDFQDVQTDEAMDLIEETGATYPQVADPSAAIDGAEPFPRLAGIPFLAFVDADGVVTHREFVIIDSPEQLADLASEHLGVDL
ncbi:hypothetical protein GCM10009737_13850 [Nocardioides lentus]|uniref:Thioredoxin domain-containing protein n=1 Tax=Nocardioides lentus TaxID=338077 RepID=A0ABP5AIQ8_9ACTN